MKGSLRKNSIISISYGISERTLRAGMTLIELMVALFIFTFVAMMLFTMMRTNAQVRRRTRERMDRYARVRSTMERLVRDLNMAYVSLGENLNLQTRRTMFIAEPEGDFHHLTFSYFGHIPTAASAKEGDTAVVEYFVEDTEDGPTLFRRETHRLANDDPSNVPGEAIPMIPALAQFSVEMYDPTRDEWQERWNTTAADGQPNRLPSLVRIHIAVESPSGGVVDFYTETELRVTDGINLMPSSMPVNVPSGGGRSTGRRPGSSSKTTLPFGTPSLPQGRMP